jgi:hypothetical protein
VTIIALRAGATNGKSYAVFVGGKKVERCVSVRALWNGGPGIVEYHPTNIKGHVYLSINHPKEVARAFLVGKVRVSEIQA